MAKTRKSQGCDAILAAADTPFRERGYHATTQDDVVARSGHGHGGLIPRHHARHQPLRRALYCGSGADSDRLDHLVSQSSKTLAEDQQILEMQMDGIRCGRIARGRLVASREPSVPEVQALILKAYREGLSAAARIG